MEQLESGYETLFQTYFQNSPPILKDADLHINIFSCVKWVKGYNRSLICDLQRGNYKLITNELFDLLAGANGKAISQIRENNPEISSQKLREYLDFLEQEEFIFYTDIPDQFPEIDLSFDIPSIIGNAIIDAGDYLDRRSLGKVVRELEMLGSRGVQLRFFNKIAFEKLLDLIKVFEGSSILYIDLIICSNPDFAMADLLDMISKEPRIFDIFVHSHPENLLFQYEENAQITFSITAIDSSQHCGIIHPNYFRVDQDLYAESLSYNNCLNKKISIDEKGFIKNCPSMEKSYGNIKDTTLREVLSQGAFKSLWNINKDQIEICKDCEFRYICTDCRAYTQDPENVYSKPLKCTYNPYTNEWGNG